MFYRLRISFTLLTLLIFPSGAVAQFEVGSIVGAVTDPSGSRVASAAVEAREITTNATRKSSTSSTGEYAFIGLRPGTYVIKVTQEGFAEQSRTVRLSVSDRVEINLALAIGTATTSVGVSASVNTIEVGSSELGNVRSQKQVQDLPLNSRNFTQLVYLAPGVNNKGNSANSVSQGYTNGRGTNGAVIGGKSAGRHRLSARRHSEHGQ